MTSLCQTAANRSIVLSQSIYLCVYVRSLASGQLYVIYFSAHCAVVTNMFPRYNLSPAAKIYHRHRCMKSIAAPAKKNY